MADPFEHAAAALADPSVPASDLSEPLLGLLPVVGASISTLGTILASETVSATDVLAKKIDELQFDLGEGPCWDALAAATPVLARDLRDPGSPQWPAFSEAVAREDVSALFAFPVLFGPLRLGAIDLYATDPVRLSREQVTQMMELTNVIGRRILEHALDSSARAEKDDEPPVGNPYSRRTIHQATGVVLAQLAVTPEDAHLLIQGQAFASHRTMVDVADDLLAGHLLFRRSEAGIVVEEVPHD